MHVTHISRGQVTDYRSIVKSKMDMDTVKKSLKHHRQPTVEALFADIFKVYTNATTYYEQGGKWGDEVVYRAAKVRRRETSVRLFFCFFTFIFIFRLRQRQNSVRRP